MFTYDSANAAKRLNLPLMVDNNGAHSSPQILLCLLKLLKVSRQGISAADRAKTILAATAPNASCCGYCTTWSYFSA